jgi:diguanylate cyclase (GGDEF)-like protein/PAS domain S-box-containing protein
MTRHAAPGDGPGGGAGPRLPDSVPSAGTLAQATIESTAALVLVCDGAGRILLANPALQEFTGRSGADLLGRPLWEILVVPEEVHLAREAVTEAMTGTHRVPREVTWLAAGGVRRQIELQSSVLREDGRPYATAFVGIDVTAQRQREEELRYQATTDALTGLANRGALFQELEASLDPACGAPSGVLFCDVDEFKAINDRFGHQAGDRVLVETAARLREVAGADDVVARVGGDEFVLLRPHAGMAELTELAEAIRIRMQAPVEGVPETLRVVVSVGAAVGVPGEAVDDVLARADTQMYGSKTRHYRSGRR